MREGEVWSPIINLEDLTIKRKTGKKDVGRIIGAGTGQLLVAPLKKQVQN